MPGPRNPWTEYALGLLTDGEWHPWEEIVKQGMEYVPPGLAYRKAEANRTACRRRYAQRHGLPTTSIDDHPRSVGGKRDAIRTGQRLVITESLMRKPYIEVCNIDGVKMVRRDISWRHRRGPSKNK